MTEAERALLLFVAGMLKEDLEAKVTHDGRQDDITAAFQLGEMIDDVEQEIRK